MKKCTKRTMWTVFCVVTGLSLFFAGAPTAKKTEKLSQRSKVERYEDKAIGFSIEYDAEIFTKDLGPVGPFVFRRESSKGMPTIAISAEVYPQGVALKDTVDLIAGSIPRMLPGSIIHEVYNQELIKLNDGTEAVYFEMKWNMMGTELITAFVAAKKIDRLIVFAASDNVEGSVENLATMVKSLRLDVEVDVAGLKAKGFGKDGKFARTDPPAFTLEYPKEFQNQPLLAGQIFSAGIPQGLPSISISISHLKAGEDMDEQLKALGEEYANILQSLGSDIKIVSQNPIGNYKGFNASQIQILWRFRGQILVTTIVHIIAKEDKAILLAGHTIYGIEELLDIFKTVNLNP